MKLTTEKMFKLMNHDSSHTAPIFESYTVEEYNEQYETNYSSIEEAIEADPEYLYTETEMQESLAYSIVID